MDFYTVTVQPVGYPVTLAEIKLFLKIDHSAEDDLLNGMIAAATLELEKFTNRVFIERTFLGEFDAIRGSKYEKYCFIETRRAPMKTLTSVKGVVDGFEEDIAGTKLKNTATFARILFTETIQNLDCDEPRPIKVVFVAGYGEASAVPEDIKLAIKMLVNFLYNNRGDCAANGLKDPGIRSLASPYKIINTFG